MMSPAQNGKPVHTPSPVGNNNFVPSKLKKKTIGLVIKSKKRVLITSTKTSSLFRRESERYPNKASISPKKTNIPNTNATLAIDASRITCYFVIFIPIYPPFSYIKL